MTQITITLDEQLVDNANRAACHQQTSLSELIRNFVEQLAAQDEALRSQTATELKCSFQQLSRPMGGVDWANREELHER